MSEAVDGMDALVSLGDGQRRQVFAIVRAARRPISRADVARAAGISRKLAAFHLDKLVAAGLLTSGFGTPDGIRRVGRRPKLYAPSTVDIRVMIPPRHHELLAGILVTAVGETEAARPATLRSAVRHGEAVGAAERDAVRPGRLGPERGLTLTAAVLDRYGFEPVRAEQGLVRLRNCPFHPLADRDRNLVCGMNHAFIDGVVGGLGASAVTAVLAPAPGHCCVELRTDSRR